MAEIFIFPTKKMAVKTKQELIENFSIRLAGFLTSACYYSDPKNISIIQLCQSTARIMVQDNCEYTQDVLDNLLDDPEIRPRTLAPFLQYLKDREHI